MKKLWAVFLGVFAVFSFSFASNPIYRDINALEYYFKEYTKDAYSYLFPYLYKTKDAPCLCIKSDYILRLFNEMDREYERAKYKAENEFDFEEDTSPYGNYDTYNYTSITLENEAKCRRFNGDKMWQMMIRIEAHLEPRYIRQEGYLKYDLINVFTCDAIIARANYQFEKRGNTLIVRETSGGRVLETARFKRGLYQISFQTPYSKISGTYDKYGLHINEVKFPYDWQSSNEVAKLDENLKKNMDKLPLYITNLYNKFLNERIEGDRNSIIPFAVINFIASDPYNKKVALLIKIGYEITEGKITPKEAKEKYKDVYFKIK